MLEMTKFLLIFAVFGIFLCRISALEANPVCENVSGSNGTIGTSSQDFYHSVLKCWEIKVPENRFMKLKFRGFVLYNSYCTDAYLEINSTEETGEKYRFCPITVQPTFPITVFTDVRITFFHRERLAKNIPPLSFSLYFEIRDVECARKGSFHCSNFSCIPSAEVCDGVKDCENGADEVGCETGVVSVSGVGKARSKEISWLKNKRTSSWGWRENTARAVTALFLAGEANFNGTDLEKELMAKQTELKTSVALLKNPISGEQLSMLINGLLVTCHSPSHFYGHNLMKKLKDQVDLSDNFTNPIAYLTLCNGNESWPLKASEDLRKVLSSPSDYPFVRDYQAIAVMAVSCYENATRFLNKTENKNLKKEYQKVIQSFKELQSTDGSFGNHHTTALITQALISSGQEHEKDWQINATVKYLMKALESPHDFLGSYLTLPVLNGKSLSDIARVNCSTNPRKHRYDNLASEINDYAGLKIRVQYSLYIGEEKDAIHTISLRVPEKYSAYDVMELAEVQDYKFKFKYHSLSGMMYVYDIGEVANDAEAGLFWLLYQGLTNSTSSLKHYNKGPDQLVMNNGDHLVMWYKKAQV